MMKQMLKKLDAILQLMLEEREERKTLREITALEERDKELVRKAKEHINKEASPVISSAGRNTSTTTVIVGNAMDYHPFASTTWESYGRGVGPRAGRLFQQSRDYN